MTSSIVDSPGEVGSPRTTARSAPGGSRGGTSHRSAAGSAEVWAIATEADASESKTAPSIALMRTLVSHQRRLSPRAGRRLSDEGEEIGVDDVRLGGRHAVWEALVRLQGAVLQQLGRQRCGIGVRHD